MVSSAFSVSPIVFESIFQESGYVAAPNFVKMNICPVVFFFTDRLLEPGME